MKIGTRLTLLFALLTAVILLIFATVIYLSAKASREKEYYALLKKEALTKANDFFNADVEIPSLQKIYYSNRKLLNEVEVAIYDTSFQLLYHDAADVDSIKETRGMIDSTLTQEILRFYVNDWQAVTVKYSFKNKLYVVTAVAYDEYGYDKLSNLLKSLVTVFLLSIIIIFGAGYFFSQNALAPLKQIVDKAKKISATNLDLRLDETGSKDELAELAVTFNAMLGRLENSFEAQKHFVSNVSHEVRTPLSAMIAELELALNKDLSTGEYRKSISEALSDAKRLNRLTHSLLDFAKASYDPSEISFKSIRVDEILLDARNQVKHSFPAYHMDIYFENDFEDDKQISVIGNDYLLKVAFANLFENGCKFSADKSCSAYVNFGPGALYLRFLDKGIGIPTDELNKVFTPFFRGGNRTYAYGNGIGLALTQKIIVMHKGTLSIQSEEGKGSEFKITLPTKHS